MFWSGADFDEAGLDTAGKKFKDASVFYTDVSDIDKTALRRWLKKARKFNGTTRTLSEEKASCRD